MSASADIESAKRLYEELFRDEQLGDKRVREIKPDTAADVVARIVPVVAPSLADPKLELKFPSPYHAALWLTMLQLLSAYGHPVKKIDQLNPDRLKDVKILANGLTFRGQADACWSLQPKAYRSAIDRKDALKRLLSFVRLLDYLIARVIHAPMDILGHVAMAQHYQITTDLLDFTCDPTVAVHFAATGNVESGHEDHLAVVYSLPSSELVNLYGQIVLPPPIGERLYMQRGLFIRVPEDKVGELSNRCSKVLFPRDKDFLVYRKGSPVNLMEDNACIRALVSWAHKWVDDKNEFSEEDAELSKQLEEQYKIVASDCTALSRDAAEELCEQWKENSYDMIIRLAHLPNPERESGENVNASLLRLIARDNQLLVSSLAVDAADIARQQGPVAGRAHRNYARLLKWAIEPFVGGS